MTPDWTAPALQAWLTDKLAAELRIPAADIDPRTPFSQYGLDSVTAVTLSADLEDLLGRTFEATLFWDHPTLDELVGFLLGQAPEPASTFTDDEQSAIARLLAEVNKLSDDDLKEALGGPQGKEA